MSDFDGIEEGKDLVAFALKGVAEPSSVDNKATCNGIALGLVADKFDVHNFGFLFFVAILVIYPYQTTAEGEDFAKGDEDGVMDLCQWWAEEARHQHRASKDAQCHSGDELEVFHGLGSYLPLITLIYTDESRIRDDP